MCNRQRSRFCFYEIVCSRESAVALYYIYICLLWCFILLGKICGLTCMALVMITLDIARWIQAKTFTACWCFCRCYEVNFSRHKQWIKITMNLTAAWSPSYRTFPRGWGRGLCAILCVKLVRDFVWSHTYCTQLSQPFRRSMFWEHHI